jgi:hypothetical protein
MPLRQRSPTGGRANFYIDNLERLRPKRRFCRAEKWSRKGWERSWPTLSAKSPTHAESTRTAEKVLIETSAGERA